MTAGQAIPCLPCIACVAISDLSQLYPAAVAGAGRGVCPGIPNGRSARADQPLLVSSVGCQCER